jgi:hypothetical protein
LVRSWKERQRYEQPDGPLEKELWGRILAGYLSDLVTMQIALDFERAQASDLVGLYEQRLAQINHFLSTLCYQNYCRYWKVPGGANMSASSSNEGLPCSEEAERGLLSCFVQQPGTMMEDSHGRLTHQLFYIETYRILFEIACEWTSPDKPVPIHFFCRALDQTGKNKHFGDRAAFINEVYTAVPGAPPNEQQYYLELAFEYWQRRSLVRFANKLGEAATLERGIKPEDLIADSIETISKLHRNGTEEIQPWDRALQVGMCSSEQLSGLSIAPRTRIVGDWMLEGDLGFIYARRGLGKTWLALDLAHGIAEKRDVGPWQVHQQLKCLYLDGEMAPDDIRKRDYALGEASPLLSYVNHEILFQRARRVMNLADRDFQKAVLANCKDNGFRVLFLDNLSCLASGMDENKAIDWEILLPWLLELRRAHLTVVFIAHAGRNNEMRGHSKREDPAFWIVRLDAPLADTEGQRGARFISRFTKWRSIQKPATYQWNYTPVGPNDQEVCVEAKLAAPIDVFRQLIESGLETASQIAEEMDVTTGYVSQLATRAKKDGWLSIADRRYRIPEGAK